MTTSGSSTPAIPWYEIDVVALVSLERLDANLFRSRVNQGNINGFLYGGQVISQALSAACGTVPAGQPCNSLHGYFLRGGKCDEPVIYEVERTRNGRSFSTRRVVALQQGEPILHMECSFHVPEEGLSHARPMPDVPPPEALADVADVYRSLPGELPPLIAERFMKRGPIELRPTDPDEVLRKLDRPQRRIWLRVPSAAASDDPAVQQQILTYMSDYWLSGVVLAPHVHPMPSTDYFIASVDHAVWFHRPARIDEWLLYDTESPFAGGGTGVSRGALYDRAGHLVATVVQETVFRKRKT